MGTSSVTIIVRGIPDEEYEEIVEEIENTIREIVPVEVEIGVGGPE